MFKNEQPNLLVVLSLVEFFIGFAFFGTLAILILYLLGTGLTDKISYGVWKNFDALIYMFCLIGGVFGGRYLSFKQSCLIGIILMFLGYLILSFNTHEVLPLIEIGLAFAAFGTGIVSPNIRNLLGTNYKDRVKRYNGFTIFHLPDILGQILGPTVLTYIGLYSKTLMFSTACLSVFLALITFLFFYKNLNFAPDDNKLKSININQNLSYIIKILIFLTILVLAILVMRLEDVGYILLIFGIGAISYVIKILYNSAYADKIKIISLLWLMIGFLAAEICYRQGFSILNLFTLEYVDKHLNNYIIPTGVFQSVEPFFVLIMAPLFLYLWKSLDKKGIKITSGSLFSAGLLLLTASFGSLLFGILTTPSGHGVHFVWLLTCYGFMSCSELMILPIGIAAVVELSPERWKGLLMGCWLLLISLASFINGQVGQFISPVIKEAPTLLTYQYVFSGMTIFAFFSGILLYIIWKFWWKKYQSIIS